MLGKRYNLMAKAAGPSHNQYSIPLKCRVCGKHVKPSNRQHQYEQCNRCMTRSR